MTELLAGDVEVRTGESGVPTELRTAAGWRLVREIVNHWRVETDWWRVPLDRDYLRCLLDGGECVEIFRDAAAGSWHWSRRYD